MDDHVQVDILWSTDDYAHLDHLRSRDDYVQVHRYSSWTRLRLPLFSGQNLDCIFCIDVACTAPNSSGSYKIPVD
jgi:hypothetical protein